ncbi:MAG: ribulose-phosphate 3-epimerase [Rhabdochlamydiaceae bacterium]
MQKKAGSKKQIQIFPSILSGDFGRIADEAKRAEDAGADGLHLDIMDGHFVPNLTFGPKVVAAINRATSLFLDVHLMMYNPFDYIERFVESGADNVTFHFEATEDIHDTLAFIRKCGVKNGLAFRPETSQEMVQKFLKAADLILLMSVNPGFGGQPFIPKVLKKIEYTRMLAQEIGVDLDIQVDGGINAETGARCVKAGANILVAGHYLYQTPEMKQAIEKLR